MKKLEFDTLMIQPHAMEWFMTLFIRILPFEFVVRIFDILLVRGFYVVFRFAMALFQILKPAILKCDNYPELMQMLKSPIKYLSKISPDQFIDMAMKFKITKKLVAGYIADYKKKQKEEEKKKAEKKSSGKK